LAFGVDVFGKKTSSSQYVSYTSQTLGGNVRFGIPITDNITANVRYSPYIQKLELPTTFNNCNNLSPDFINTFPTPSAYGTTPATTFPGSGNPASAVNQNCYADGEASLAVRQMAAQGWTFTSLVGYGLSYNTLDNNRNPTSGVVLGLTQDVAGVGGDVHFVKTVVDGRLYNEIFPDIIGFAHVQAGNIVGWGPNQLGGTELRMIDLFQGGPNLVRGFQPSGWGPRDLTTGTNLDALGGSNFWSATYEIQTPVFFAPKDFGIRLAFFADAGQLWDYKGPTTFAQTGEAICIPGVFNPQYPKADLAAACNDQMIRTSAGVGLLWDSPLGPLRFDLAFAITKQPYDRTQIFRFGGGTRF
jgi:outer membrane protein insertion porin family